MNPTIVEMRVEEIKFLACHETWKKPDDEKDGEEAAKLGLDNVGGVFVVMTGGAALSCVFACCEFSWKARKLATEEGATFSEELWKEIKFILNCSANSKPVRKKQTPPGSESSNFSTGNYAYAPEPDYQK